MSLGSLYLFFYAILFLISIKLYMDDPYNEFKDLNLFGFLHLIFIIYIFCYPINKLPRESVPFISTSRGIVNILYWYTIILSLFSIYEIYLNLSSGSILLLFTDSSYGNEAYAETRASMDVIKQEGRSLNFLSVFIGQAHCLAPFMFIYSLIDPYCKLFKKIALAICVLFNVLNAVSMGSRYGIVVPIMQCFCFYFFVRIYLGKRLRRIVTLSGISLGIFIVAALWAITTSRAEGAGKKDESTVTYIESYMSQGILFYDKYAYNHGENREGDRIAPLVKRLLGFSDVADSYAARLTKYKRMKINEVNFITFAGDFMLDFGFFAGNFILLVLALFYNKNLRHVKKISFSELCLVYMLVVTLNGFSLYVFVDITGNLFFFILLFLHFITKNRQRVVQPIATSV